MKNSEAIVLGAGKGTRLNSSDIPKVLRELAGRPMILYAIENLEAAGLQKSIVVIGFQGEKVKQLLGDRVRYAWQKEQLGTAHAVKQAQPLIDSATATILVLSGDDSAFYKPETLQNLITTHQQENAAITVLTVKHHDPTGLGRILRNKDDVVVGIIEEKAATQEQKTIREVNTSCYCFRPDFIWKNIPKIKRSASGEYYLTDLVALAAIGREKVVAVEADPQEWWGVNTPEELARADEKMRERVVPRA